MKTALVMTTGHVSGFEKGSHGNGRVVILTDQPGNYKSMDETFSIHRDGLLLMLSGTDVDDVYIYIGRLEDPESAEVKIVQKMLDLAFSLKKDDPGRIHVVGCQCNGERKKLYAKESGFDFVSCECGGEKTLGNIVKEILSRLPVKEKPRKKFSLELDFSSDQDGRFSEFSALGETIFSGRTDGNIFWKKAGVWQEFGLKLNQGVNLMVPDGNSVLVGDGSCCSGATWRLKIDGSWEKILPISGQEDEENTREGKRPSENIRCNVYGFARIGKRLLTGGGGCAGEHIYELNDHNKWQYIANDPKKYVTHMLTGSDGKVYIAMNLGRSQEGFYSFDGNDFPQIGSFPGISHAIKEYEGVIYLGSTDSGQVYPTNRSMGYIYRLKNSFFERIWEGTGGIRGFFELNSKFYAFGVNYVDYSTILLEFNGEEWKKLAEFDQALTFFSHSGIVYAGGEKNKKAAVFTIIL